LKRWREYTAVARPRGEHPNSWRSVGKKNNARHFTMKGRAFKEAVVLSGGKADGLMLRGG